MILKLEIFGAKFNAHFCQYQQGSPQKRLIRFGRSVDGNYEFSNAKVMVRHPQSQLGNLRGGAVSYPARSGIFSFFNVFLRIKYIV